MSKPVSIDFVINIPQYGPVRVKGCESVLEDFQYRLRLVQEVQIGTTPYKRTAHAYFYLPPGGSLPALDSVLPGRHIQRIKSLYPLFEDHRPNEKGWHYAYRLVEGMQEDLLIDSEEQFEVLAKVQQSMEEDLVPDLTPDGGF